MYDELLERVQQIMDPEKYDPVLVTIMVQCQMNFAYEFQNRKYTSASINDRIITIEFENIIEFQSFLRSHNIQFLEKNSNTIVMYFADFVMLFRENSN